MSNPESCVVALVDRTAVAPADSIKVENTTKAVLLCTVKARTPFSLNNRFESL